jgi:hypothetical protein
MIDGVYQGQTADCGLRIVDCGLLIADWAARMAGTAAGGCGFVGARLSARDLR